MHVASFNAVELLKKKNAKAISNFIIKDLQTNVS